MVLGEFRSFAWLWSTIWCCYRNSITGGIGSEISFSRSFAWARSCAPSRWQCSTYLCNGDHGGVELSWPLFSMLGDMLWLAAVGLHIIFLVSFVYHRAKEFELHHMVPSWFVPPVGIIVADVSFSGNPDLLFIANGTLLFGMLAYAVMLPMMIYRFMFTHQVPDAAKPTLAIMAAPASLSLAGYLTVVSQPSPVIVGLLFGIGVLMTAIIYLAFFKLLRLPFSPGYAAFTFPMAIGSTALFKLANWMQTSGLDSQYVHQIHMLAGFELIVATGVIAYVAIRYFNFYQPHKVIVRNA